jgi:nucleoside-diphosphate-sugar epimerase
VTGADVPRPVSAYGRSKLAGEQEARSLPPDVPLTILRPPVIFGPRDRMLRSFFQAVSKGVMIVWRDGSNRFSVSYAPDVARAALLALEVDHPSGSVVYPCNETDFDWRGLIAALASILGRRVRVLPLPGTVFAVAAAASTGFSLLSGRPPALSFDKLAELREAFWLCSREDARRLLGWQPSVPIVQALAETHGWYRSRGLL